MKINALRNKESVFLSFLLQIVFAMTYCEWTEL